MEISRLTFTKETKKKMSEPLTSKRKGQLRWQRLKELEASGALSKARVRTDITKMMGLGGGYGAGYSWVSSLVKRGCLQEIMLGIKDGRYEYEYHIVGEPDYEKKKLTLSQQKRNNKQKQNNQIRVVTNKPAVAETTMDKPTKMTIKYRDLSIEIENVSIEMIEHIVERLANIQ